MRNNPENSKQSLMRLLITAAENVSSTKEKAREYLSSEGVNVDKVVSDGLTRIKKIQMEVSAEKTRQEMFAAQGYQREAEAFVEQLLNSVNFSIPELIQKEELSVSFRNIESLSKEDIRAILIKHYTLKLYNEKKGD